MTIAVGDSTISSSICGVILRRLMTVHRARVGVFWLRDYNQNNPAARIRVVMRVMKCMAKIKRLYSIV